MLKGDLMRSVVFATVLAMSGCASSSDSGDGTEFTNLDPTQLRQAFAGTAGCIVYEEDGLCESMIFVDSVSGREARIREVGASDIAQFVAEPMAEFVRQLPMFANYDDLFQRLEIQRRRGGFRYIKSVTSYVSTFNPETSLWCSRPGGGFEGTRFYFSNSFSAHITADEPLDNEMERQLRGFLNAVLDDPTFRAQIEPHPQELMGLELMRGNAQGCTSYGGLVVSGRIEARNLAIFANGVAVPYLRNAIRPYPLNDELPLRAN
ncbi:MAG: hypothetical protein DCF16_19165 [Alphaproteobacteria bacterium]|nr:MAG: hypothetical protein DCF16_19165 [Alphaproteobacteria bacterium]